MKKFELLKVWEDICRALHPLRQRDYKCRERAEYVEAGGFHEVEYSIKIRKIQCGEVGRGSCSDCSHKW